MSSPNTNIETQKRRHRGVLIGMAVAVALGLTAFALNTNSAVTDGEGPLIDEIAEDDAQDSADIAPSAAQDTEATQ